MSRVKKVDVIEELKVKTVAPSSPKVLNEVKLLLDGNARAEIEALENIGIDKHIRLARQAREKEIKFNDTVLKFEELDVISLEAIHHVCEKYRLFVKPASLYDGAIPADLGAVLLRLNAKYQLGIDLKAEYIKDRFYVMAPPEMFSDYLSMTDKIKAFLQDEDDYMHEVRRRRMEMLNSIMNDPIMLYKDPESGLFIALKKWGNDFNILREIIGFFGRTNFLPKAFFWLTIIAVTVLAFTLGAKMLYADFIFGHDAMPDKVAYVNEYGQADTRLVWPHGLLSFISMVGVVVLAFLFIGYVGGALQYYLNTGRKHSHIFTRFKTKANIFINNR